MTCLVTIKAESHDCEVRELPVHNGVPTPWDQLSKETRRFGSHIVRLGDSLDMYVHSGRAILVLEVHTPAKCSHPKITESPDNADEGTCDVCGVVMTRQRGWKLTPTPETPK